MKQSPDAYKIGIVCLLLLGIGGVTWAAAHQWSKSAGKNSGADSTPAIDAAQQNPLASLPVPAGSSLSDTQIAKWIGVVRKTGTDETAWASLGDSYMQKARETADVTYYNHAERAYQRALALKPNNAAALTGLAWVNGGRHEFEKSIEYANRVLAIDAKNNDAYGLIGDAEVEMGQYDAAFGHYQQMLDIRPDSSSYSRGAHLLWLMGDERKGMWLMGKAIKSGAPYSENTAWCRAQFAQMMVNTGALLPAEQMLTNTLKENPNSYQLLAAMGRVQASKRNYAAAIKYYTKAVEVVPMHDSLAALADLYQVTNKPEEVKKEFAVIEATRQLLKANGVRGDMQIARFYADHDMNIPEAVREEEEEIKTRPNVYVQDTLAWCYYKAGRYTKAEALEAKALARHTPEAMFEFHAGMIDVKLNRNGSARKHLYNALNLNPNFSIVYAPIASAELKELGSKPLDAREPPITVSSRP